MKSERDAWVTPTHEQNDPDNWGYEMMVADIETAMIRFEAGGVKDALLILENIRDRTTTTTDPPGKTYKEPPPEFRRLFEATEQIIRMREENLNRLIELLRVQIN
ncbi:MAG: hypothetical protein WDN47_01700 [Candidatus Doudnabacteria bacterium]